jgi:dipeptidyl aminopeptidase/acylaminoacyl peptidase
MAQIAPYGSWRSPITVDQILEETVGLGGLTLDGADVYWNESRAKEQGRVAVVRRTPDGATHDLFALPFNARTRVHEYGGGAYVVIDGELLFSNFDDNRLYRVAPGGEPRAITPESARRYADLRYDRGRKRLIAVCEDHGTGAREAINTLVALDLSGRATPDVVLASGNDFYSSPALSPASPGGGTSGQRLAWLEWSHPNLPWDGSDLWLAELAPDGSIASRRHVAGGPHESIFQPQWSPDGVLYFVSDRTGWWNLYRWRDGQIEAVAPMEAEFAEPQWLFGMSYYAFISARQLVCAYEQNGLWRLALIDTASKSFAPLPGAYPDIGSVRSAGGKVYFYAAFPAEVPALIALDPTSGQINVLRRASGLVVDPGYISLAEAVEFPTENGLTAHGFFYRPRNQDFVAPAGELPPLYVLSHGGPTGSTTAELSLAIQFWTSRGFAVLDVNYGGSTGYGRAYRERLNGNWGVVDVDDCVNGARYLVDRKLVDGARLIIQGGSAGGYTTLAALTFRDVFKAGASYFGIGDLEVFAGDTHKFESRYLDGLIGPYPERADVYRARSPINFVDRITCPMIILQGLDDKIVPPNQAQLMVSALRAKGLPFAYVAFEGEGHGFRKAENIKRSIEAELYFYSRVFGFELADDVQPVEIENL